MAKVDKGPQDTVQFLGVSNTGHLDKKAFGQLKWQLTIAPGSTVKMWFAVAGTNVNKFKAYAALFTGLGNPDELLTAKIKGRLRTLAQTEAKIPDPSVQAAFDWAKLNLADMRRVVQNAEIRDTKEGTVYDPPIAFFPLLSGFGAGYPDYPWFFGPAKSILAEVSLNGRPVSYQIRDTHRGREVIVTTNSGQPLQLTLTTR